MIFFSICYYATTNIHCHVRDNEHADIAPLNMITFNLADVKKIHTPQK